MKVIFEQGDWRVGRWNISHTSYAILHNCNERTPDGWDALCPDELNQRMCTLQLCHTHIPKEVFMIYKELSM